MNRILTMLTHYFCEGIYVRTKTSFSSVREKYPQLNADYLFQAENLTINATGRTLKDSDGCYHRWSEVRPSTRAERKKFATANPKKKAVHI